MGSPAVRAAARAACTSAAVVMPAHHRSGLSGWFLMAASTAGLGASAARQAMAPTSFRPLMVSGSHGPDGLTTRRVRADRAGSAFALARAALSVGPVTMMTRLAAFAGSPPPTRAMRNCIIFWSYTQ